MKNAKFVLFIGYIFASFVCCSMNENEVQSQKYVDRDIYKKRYDILFRRCPEKSTEELFHVLRNPPKRGLLKGFYDVINQSNNYFDLGGSIEDFEKKDKKNVDEQIFDVKNLRKNLLYMLLKLIENNEDFAGVLHEGNEYIAKTLISNQKRVLSGQRGDGSNVKEPIIIKNLIVREKEYEECCKNNEDCSSEKKKLDEFKKRLAAHYKIHLMPQESDILKVVQILMRSLKKDDELGALIDKFKIKADLSLQYQRGDKEMPYALIVIYPAEGKDKVQKLLDKLLVLFKDIKGLDILPRYNLKVNGLIFYAQGDADDKKSNKKGEKSKYLKYFDENKNYALYKDDFEEQPHESYELKF